MPQGHSCDPPVEWWQGGTAARVLVPAFRGGDLRGVVAGLDRIEVNEFFFLLGFSFEFFFLLKNVFFFLVETLVRVFLFLLKNNFNFYGRDFIFNLGILL